mmetsp:Transcript_16713/g.28041  ORF Transcript_16713/g.28041 Transcript_16713/m.28041 type:complete len:84 (-) Transcript_16713:96-347(-)
MSSSSSSKRLRISPALVVISLMDYTEQVLSMIWSLTSSSSSISSSSSGGCSANGGGGENNMEESMITPCEAYAFVQSCLLNSE